MERTIEKRGFALNQYRNLQELISLRNGELKFFDSDVKYL